MPFLCLQEGLPHGCVHGRRTTFKSQALRLNPSTVYAAGQQPRMCLPGQVWDGAEAGPESCGDFWEALAVLR